MFSHSHSQRFVVHVAILPPDPNNAARRKNSKAGRSIFYLSTPYDGGLSTPYDGLFDTVYLTTNTTVYLTKPTGDCQ